MASLLKPKLFPFLAANYWEADMYSLIGSSPSAKFIFFALDDYRSNIDDRTCINDKRIKDILDVKRVNIYKRHGHYREQLNEIDTFFFLRRQGFFESRSFGDNGFTHVARFDADCELNLMVELTFGATIIGYLHLSDDLLKSLHNLLENLSNLKSAIRTAESEKYVLLKHLTDIRKLEMMRNQLLIPQDQVVADIFEDYGLIEKQAIEQRFDEWYQLARWEVKSLASNDALSEAA